VREHGRTATSEGYYANAMEGSSLMVVPRWMKFFTAGIEYHHIHHLNAKVASYSLQACHDNVSPAGARFRPSFAPHASSSPANNLACRRRQRACGRVSEP
jgi:fatty acid desaturase